MGASAFVAQTFFDFWLFCTSRPPYIPVSAGLGEELMKILRDNNEGRFNGRWTGERPPIRVSQNTRTGTGNIKLQLFSWEIAEELVKKGLRIGDKTHKV